jgi:tetratricopeptide (TPR) repeat protein
MSQKLSDTEITEGEKQQALDAILNSELFARLERICEFLTYIVQEEIAGDGDAIRGKNIARDVYGRDPNKRGDPENIVRVEARRLRQTLELYYETVGKDDPVRIHMGTGGYHPRFEKVDLPNEVRGSRRWKWLGISITTFAVGSLIGMAVVLLMPGVRDSPLAPSGAEHDSKKILERQAILDKSPASLQAVNLAEQARTMILPIFDRPRQQLVTEVFRRAIELDPYYFGGYAGAAQTIGMLAIMAPTGPAKDELLAMSNQMAQEAIRLDPSNSWVQSAKAVADLASGNYDEARIHSQRAIEIDPNDGNVLDFHGTISLFTGNFVEAVASVENSREKGGSTQRSANRNIFGAASFHLGKYERSLEAFQAAAKFGDPISAPSFAFQAAGLHALGRTDDALQIIDELNAAWPDADLNTMLRGIYQYSEHASQVLDHLVELGWSK